MTTLDTGHLGRAALVSPGSALAPQDTEARADHLQRRVQLFAQLLFILGVFFLVAGAVHRFVFLHAGPLAHFAPEPALVTHLVMLSLQGLVWMALRRRRFRQNVLRWVDALLLLITLSAVAFQTTHVSLGIHQQPHLLLVLATLTLCMCRAVIVPSEPWFTLGAGFMAVSPALMVAMRAGANSGHSGEILSFAGIWLVAALALTTFTSSVLYGLRRSVAKAQLGQYVIEKKLGEGGMGEVYLARHTLLRRPTAVKLLPPERAGRKTIARFEREVRATSRLSHPNTVSIYDYGHTAEGVFYYAMEYLDGSDLQALVKQHGPLSPARVVHVLAQVAGALAEAHAAGLVHRDLKPANVFLCERGGMPDTVKVLDFGLVKDTTGEPGTAQTDVNVLMGTPAYLSPEAIHSPTEVDARSDIYAVGALGYFLLTGREVFEGNSVVALCIAHLHEKPQAPSRRLGRALPAQLEQLVLGCLEKAPEARPQSASDLRHAFQGMVGSLETMA
jgi:serine/threonine-protein kinase